MATVLNPRRIRQPIYDDILENGKGIISAWRNAKGHYRYILRYGKLVFLMGQGRKIHLDELVREGFSPSLRFFLIQSYEERGRKLPCIH